MTRRIRTAIFPVAGRGTRMLPATRAVPKELLPVLDKPLIDFAISEALEAGIDQMIFISHAEKSAIREHVENSLGHSRPTAKFIYQKQQLGLGHAVLAAREYVGTAPFAVLLPDDLILGSPGCMSEMQDAYETLGTGHLVAAMDVSLSDTSKYGIFSSDDGEKRLFEANTLIEKPTSDLAPSAIAAVGRYILDHSIFDQLAKLFPPVGKEIQLTDAIALGAAACGLSGFRFTGRRFDCGSKSGYLAATLHRAAADPVYQRVLDAVISRPVAKAA